MLVCSTAQAEQPRDFMIDVQPKGTHLFLDVIFPGVQATVQHNVPVYGDANRLRLRANTLLTMAFFESQADVEMRILNLTLGLTGGYRNTFRGQVFAPGDPLDQDARRNKDTTHDYINNVFGFVEGRIELSFPLNKHVVVHNRNAFRLEGRTPRTFDYRAGVVHDGKYIQNDIFLFLKHRKWGGIGPTIQFLSFDLDNQLEQIWNVGGTLVTRPGFFRANDLLYCSVLVNTGGQMQGRQDQGAIYGAQIFYGPVTVQLAYRVILDLGQTEVK